MVIEKISFGGTKPKEIEYNKNGTSADAWLYDNIREEETENGTEWVADGVHLQTRLSEDELIAQKEMYFNVDEPETTIADLVEALDILTGIVLGEE